MALDSSREAVNQRGLQTPATDGGWGEGGSPREEDHGAGGQLIEDQGREQLAVKVGPGELRVLGAPVVEVEDAPERFEGKFDLPAQPVEFKRLIGGEDITRQIGEDIDEGGHPQAA